MSEESVQPKTDTRKDWPQLPGRALLDLIHSRKINPEVALKRALELRQHELGTRHLGLANAAKFLQRLLWWAGTSWCEGRDEGWFYKSAAEMETETGLSRRNQETSRRLLIDFGLMAEERRFAQRPNKTLLHYRAEIAPLAVLIGQVLGATPKKQPERRGLSLVRSAPAPETVAEPAGAPALAPEAGEPAPLEMAAVAMGDCRHSPIPNGGSRQSLLYTC